MPPIGLPEHLSGLKGNYQQKLLETLSESEKNVCNRREPEEMLFADPNPLSSSAKFSNPSRFFAQPSFKDLASTNLNNVLLPADMHITLSALDQVVMESLLLAKPKELACHFKLKNSDGKTNLNRSRSKIAIPALLCNYQHQQQYFESDSSASVIMSSKNELSLGFCHDWWFAHEPRSSQVDPNAPPVADNKENKAPYVSSSTLPTTTKSSDGPRSPRRSSRRHQPQQRKNANSSRSHGSPSRKLRSTKESREATPSPNRGSLQTVKIKLNPGDQELTDGSDGESSDKENTAAIIRRKVPNTHKKGHPTRKASYAKMSSPAVSRTRRNRKRSRSVSDSRSRLSIRRSSRRLASRKYGRQPRRSRLMNM